jgi:hypothetical protein
MITEIDKLIDEYLRGSEARRAARKFEKAPPDPEPGWLRSQFMTRKTEEAA